MNREHTQQKYSTQRRPTQLNLPLTESAPDEGLRTRVKQTKTQIRLKMILFMTQQAAKQGKNTGMLSL